MAFLYRHDISDNVYLSPAIDRRNLCGTNACTATDVRRFQFRIMTNKSYIFRHHRRLPAHFGVVHVCTYAEMYSFQSFPAIFQLEKFNRLNQNEKRLVGDCELTIDAPRMWR